MGLPVQLLDLVRARRLPYLVTLHDYWWVCANANLLTNYSHESCAGPQGYLNCTHCVVARARQPVLWGATPAIIGGLAWRARRLRLALAAATQILTPSTFVRQWYGAHGLSSEHIRVLDLGVERPPAALDLPVRMQDGVIRFLYLGSVAPLKGVHVIIEALRQLHGQVELWIAGDLSIEPDYTQRLRDLATPQVRFLGRLARRQVWETLAQVDALLAPSLCQESYGLAAREAQVAGLPVIAAASGALIDVVTHEVNGLLVAPGVVEAWRSTLQRCLDEPGLLPRLRAHIPPPPTVDEHVEQIEMAYQEIVKQ
jgi:glycosyltransferase involved in cell wall biosynthesis